MKYSRFEELPVWQAGIDLTVRIFAVTCHRLFLYKGDIANQVQRAGLSIPNNVAEGFERGTTPELLTFLYYARGSAGEVRSICHVILKMPEFADLKSQITVIKDLAESISRQLRGWTDSLQNTDIKGQRYLNDKTRASYESGKRADEFVAKLKLATEAATRRKQREEKSGAI